MQKTQFKSSEDVANDYMMDLIGRILVMVSKQRSIGGAKTCRVHDLLHEFCVIKAKCENFLQLGRGSDELATFDVPRNLRRLCINSKQEHFSESRLFSPATRCLLFSDRGGYRRNIFDLSFIFRIFKLVKVLDLSQIHLGITFPGEIELLVHLRYLAVLGQMTSIPSSIGNLSNLETFIVESFETEVCLPDDIWNLKKLRHLKGKFLIGIGFHLHIDNIDKSSQLCNLETFSSVRFSSKENMDNVLRKFQNISKLKCRLLGLENFACDATNKILVLDFLSRLESLNLNFKQLKHDVQCQIEFYFSPTIKKLTLSGARLPWRKLSAIACLPNLEVLKLLERAFEGEMWSMEIEEFPEVRFLKLASLDIVQWIALDCEDHFPRLQKLVLERCHRLEEIPSSLGNVSTLEVIEVSDPPNCASSMEQILEEQMSMGYTDLKILNASSTQD